MSHDQAKNKKKEGWSLLMTATKYCVFVALNLHLSYYISTRKQFQASYLAINQTTRADKAWTKTESGNWSMINESWWYLLMAGGIVYRLQYRVIWDKLEDCRWLFKTEKMDRFLIKWYFLLLQKWWIFMWYHKNSEENLARHSESLPKS